MMSKTTRIDTFDSDFESWCAGKNLTLRSAKRLELDMRTMGTGESMISARLKLLGFYFRRAASDDRYLQSFLTLLLSHIDERPRDRIHEFLFFPKDCKQNSIATKQWLKQAQLNKNDSLVLHHAAHFCSLWQPRKAEKLWLEVQIADPMNEVWPAQLCHLYVREAARCHSPSLRLRFLRKALNSFKMTLDLHKCSSNALLTLRQTLGDLSGLLDLERYERK